ncbi:hypothetical protein TEA_004175 [Camellia sinensis var. sinensis]|uniref:Major facilitator superfamily (MFS) profile domain-containing protein n=1 Tax=Camellia sinensis var. sinensis TaxID=542762 RepID=A0A4V3WMY3_CAMSN|nr:hypothetical protein TEA_004175 [Camellia sinensis var. sinensis]
MSGAAFFIKDDLKISDDQLEVLMGIMSLYSLLGCYAAGRTSDWVGRRHSIVIAAAIFFVGAILMGFATNYAFLMVGRFVAGIGVGYALLIAPVYTAEVSPAASRGFLTSFPEVFINAGWRLMLGIGAIPSVFLALGVLAMPESPRWLVLQGRLGDAKRVLDKTSDSKEEAQLRLADIKEAAGIPEECNDDVVPVPKRSHGEGVWKELVLHPTPTVLHILIAGVGIHFFQQASGIDAVVLYSPKIFEKAAVSLTIIDHSEKKVAWAVALAITTVLSFVGTFSIGMGPIAWVYSSEIFPLRLRAQGTSIGTAMNRLISGTILMTFISLYKAILIGGAFFLFMGVAIISWVLFYTLLPETQGRTLEEMQVLFGTFFKWRSTLRELEKNKKIRDNDNSNGQIQLGTTTDS